MKSNLDPVYIFVDTFIEHTSSTLVFYLLSSDAQMQFVHIASFKLEKRGINQVCMFYKSVYNFIQTYVNNRR